MLLSELKALINEIDDEYDEHPLYNNYFTNEKVDVNIYVANYLGHEYLQVNVNEEE